MGSQLGGVRSNTFGHEDTCKLNSNVRLNWTVLDFKETASGGREKSYDDTADLFPLCIFPEEEQCDQISGLFLPTFQLCAWLASLLVSPQFLSSRALHLFLQTSHSVPRILENIEGKRDDQVVPDKEKMLGDTRNNNREGFKGVFGGPN